MMDWSMLREGKCPKCDAKLIAESLLSTIVKCGAPFCTFQIRQARLTEILNDMTGFPADEDDDDQFGDPDK